MSTPDERVPEERERLTHAASLPHEWDYPDGEVRISGHLWSRLLIDLATLLSPALPDAPGEIHDPEVRRASGRVLMQRAQSVHCAGCRCPDAPGGEREADLADELLRLVEAVEDTDAHLLMPDLASALERARSAALRPAAPRGSSPMLTDPHGGE